MVDEPDFDDVDNPEWTAEDFARAQSASELMPEAITRLLVRRYSSVEIAEGVRAQERFARGWKFAA